MFQIQILSKSSSTLSIRGSNATKGSGSTNKSRFNQALTNDLERRFYIVTSTSQSHTTINGRRAKKIRESFSSCQFPNVNDLTFSSRREKIFQLNPIRWFFLFRKSSFFFSCAMLLASNVYSVERDRLPGLSKQLFPNCVALIAIQRASQAAA